MSEKIYLWLLRLYPARFRDEYGEAMLQLFRDRLSADRNWLARLRLWTEIACDLAASVPRQHFMRSSPAVHRGEGYWLSDDAARQMVKRSHVRAVWSLFASMAVGMSIGTAGDAPLGFLLAFYSPLVILPLLTLRQSARIRRYWLSYRLTVDEDRIVLTREGAQPLTVFRSEVVRLIETPGMGLVIGTDDPRRSIWAPSLLNGYSDLCRALASWAPIEQSQVRRSWLGLHSHAGSMWLFSLYIPAVLVLSRSVFAVAGTVAALALAWMTVQMLRVPGVALKVKAIPVVMLLVLLFKAAFLFL